MTSVCQQCGDTFQNRSLRDTHKRHKHTNQITDKNRVIHQRNNNGFFNCHNCHKDYVDPKIFLKHVHLAACSNNVNVGRVEMGQQDENIAGVDSDLVDDNEELMEIDQSNVGILFRNNLTFSGSRSK